MALRESVVAIASHKKKKKKKSGKKARAAKRGAGRQHPPYPTLQYATQRRTPPDTRARASLVSSRASTSRAANLSARVAGIASLSLRVHSASRCFNFILEREIVNVLRELGEGEECGKMSLAPTYKVRLSWNLLRRERKPRWRGTATRSLPGSRRDFISTIL